jgi:hypothetical protein
MLRRISKLTFFLQFLLFIGITALFWIPEFINPKAPLHLTSEGPLYTIIADLLSSHLYLSESFALVFVIGLSLILYFIGSVNDILPRENFLSSILFIFILSWNSEILRMNPLLPAGLLVILSIYTLIKMYGQAEPYRQVFTASACVGMASLFYLPSMYFLIMIWISLVTYRVGSWREWIIALIGFIIPFIYLLSWYFWNDIFGIGIQRIISAVNDPGIVLKGIQSIEAIWMILSALILIITLITVVNLSQDKLISMRRKTFIMVNFVLACGLMILMSGSSLLLVCQLLYIPLAFFMASSLSLMKKGIILDFIFLAYLIFLGCIRLFIMP